LVVEYLYAAFSLKSSQEVSDPAQQSALQDWFDVLRLIARQEMGHLMTAQNLLLAIRLRPNLEREDFPPRKDLYPFKLHLEPLTQRSLAKYVAAEAPQDPAGIDDIIALATVSAGTTVHRVGVIYGLLGVVFSTGQSVTAGGSGSEPWDMVLRRLAAAAHQQSPASSWHLGDDAIDPQTLAFQGHTDNWPGDGVTSTGSGIAPPRWRRFATLPSRGKGPPTAARLHTSTATGGCTGAAMASRRSRPRAHGTRRTQCPPILGRNRSSSHGPGAGRSLPTCAMRFCSASSSTTC
jgi:Ferritin-like